jgi:DNA-binding MarR family transcriptional regulator
MAQMEHSEVSDARPFRLQTRQLREILDLTAEADREMQARLEVGPRDLEAMNHLIVDGPLGPTEIGRRLHITSAAATVLVDRLEAVGHVSRQGDPDDRRRQLVVPTPESAARAWKAVLPLIGAIDTVLDGLTPAEQGVVTRYLAGVITAYERYLSPGGQPGDRDD